MKGVISVFSEEAFSRHDLISNCTPEKIFFGSSGVSFPVLIQSDAQVIQVPLSSSMAEFKGILKRRPDSVLLRNKKAILLCNGFVSIENKAYVINIMGKRMASLAGIIKEEEFVPLWVKAPDALENVAKKFPAILNLDAGKEWVSTRNLEDVMALQDCVHEEWFDYYPISEKTLDTAGNSRQAIEPVGPSLSETLQKNKTKDAEFLKKARSRRGK